MDTEVGFTKRESRSKTLAVGFLALLTTLALIAVVILAVMLRAELNTEDSVEASTTPFQVETDICQGNIIDVAIIGAGASGSFAGWQISEQHNDWTIDIFDANDRVGGRLHSIPIDGIANHVADVGAMRFMNQFHVRLRRVIEQLGLTVGEFTTPQPDNAVFFLRNKLLSAHDLDNGNVPYAMTEEERNRSGSISALYAYWNNLILDEASKNSSISVWERKCTDGKFAYEKGMRTAFGEVGSAEALEFARNRNSFPGASLNNANYASYASRTQYTPVYPATPVYMKTIVEGFQALVERMIDNMLQHTKKRLHLKHKLKAVTHKNGVFQLKLIDKAKYKFVDVCAKKVMLGLPAKALKLIHFDEDMKTSLATLVDAVTVNPAGKAYFAYDRPWWRNAGQGQVFDKMQQNGTDVIYISTDTPVGSLMDIGVDDTTGKALLLSYFNWWENIRFWEPYLTHGSPHSSSSTQSEFPVTDSLINEYQRQFSRIFNMSKNDIPIPYASVFHAWYKEPYWTGWHSVKGGYNYPEVMDKIKKPMDNKDLFIVGEAFSSYHGWTEGALQTTEQVLQQYFGITEF